MRTRFPNTSERAASARWPTKTLSAAALQGDDTEERERAEDTVRRGFGHGGDRGGADRDRRAAGCRRNRAAARITVHRDRTAADVEGHERIRARCVRRNVEQIGIENRERERVGDRRAEGVAQCDEKLQRGSRREGLEEFVERRRVAQRNARRK